MKGFVQGQTFMCSINGAVGFQPRSLWPLCPRSVATVTRSSRMEGMDVISCLSPFPAQSRCKRTGEKSVELPFPPPSLFSLSSYCPEM